MQSTYVAYTDRMIDRYEGPYGWNRKDPGGPTKYGITCYDLAEHRGQKMDSMERWAPIVAAMTRAEAEDIYRNKYATYIRYDDLPAGVDACMEDYGINSGIARVMLVARRIVGTAGGSAKMDQVTLDAIRKMDPKKFIQAMCDERLAFMHAIRNGEAWAEFGGGWGARVADLRTYCAHLVDTNGAVTTAPAAPDLTKVVQPKATNVAKTAGKPTVVAAGTAGTASVTAGHPHWVSAAIVIGVFVAGVLYEAWQDTKANAANNTVHLATA